MYDTYTSLRYSVDDAISYIKVCIENAEKENKSISKEEYIEDMQRILNALNTEDEEN